MCDQDHKPFATFFGIPVVICDDAPRGGSAVPIDFVSPTKNKGKS